MQDGLTENAPPLARSTQEVGQEFWGPRSAAPPAVLPPSGGVQGTGLGQPEEIVRNTPGESFW